MANLSRLPSRFPVGTKFVIEGRPGKKGQTFTRHLEFPDGTMMRLPSHRMTRASATRQHRLRGPKKH
jgi:hypothetical protein